MDIAILIVLILNTVVLLMLVQRFRTRTVGEQVGGEEDETDWSNFEGHVPVTVGFVYDQDDIEGVAGGALILALFHDANQGIISPDDVITEYRGTPVSSGRELDLLIDRLEDVQDGEPIDMKVRARGTGEPVSVQVVSKKVETSGFKSTTFANAKCKCGTKTHKCESGSGSCTTYREWKRQTNKKYKYRMKCQASANSCSWTSWLNGK